MKPFANVNIRTIAKVRPINADDATFDGCAPKPATMVYFTNAGMEPVIETEEAIMALIEEAQAEPEPEQEPEPNG
jgi:hypothetical protein